MHHKSYPLLNYSPILNGDGDDGARRISCMHVFQFFSTSTQIILSRLIRGNSRMDSQYISVPGTLVTGFDTGLL